MAKFNWSFIVRLIQNHTFQLGLVILVAFTVRLYRIDNPVLDWHAFRQADTASVTHRYTQEGIDLLRPRYHDLSNIQSGLDNPEGYRMVEFPFVNGLTALILLAMPLLDLVIASRLISILFSVGALLSLYWLIKMVVGRQQALLSMVFMAFLPYSIFYSRVILPEPAMLFFATLSLALFVSYLKNEVAAHWWLSWICLALALLLKPFTAFWAPVYASLIFFYDPKPWKKISYYLYPVFALVPLILWRNWIAQFPEGIPASDWLLNSDQIRLRPAWFRWLFWERLTKIMAGITGLGLAIANLLKRNRILFILLTWWLGILGFFIVIATGNVRHDYYQVLAIPVLSFTLGRGAWLAYTWLKKRLKNRIIFSEYISGGIIALIAFSAVIISWRQIYGYFNVNRWEYHHVGQEVDQLLPAEAKVIAPAMGDTMFLFQTRRRGWPIGHNISQKIEQGAEFYVTINFDDEAQELEEKYITVKKTADFLILDLTRTRDETEQ